MSRALLSTEWLCTEKAHGANFSAAVACDGQVHFAARSGLLAASDNFYGYKSQGLDAYLVPRVLALRTALVRDGFVTANDTLVVYGELCGGHYPHPAVPAVAGGVGPVQRGVWYSPALVFIAFDIAVVPVAADAAAGDGRLADMALSSSHQRTRFLDFDVARAASIAADLRFTQPLRRGTLAHCLDLDVRFASTIPTTLGLPTLPAEHSNWAEGLVVRPVREPPPDGGRGLVKRKIPEFSEKQYSHNHWRGARHGAVSSRGSAGMSWVERPRARPEHAVALRGGFVQPSSAAYRPDRCGRDGRGEARDRFRAHGACVPAELRLHHHDHRGWPRLRALHLLVLSLLPALSLG
jgi:Rnl2 family RNA ligase